MICRGQHERFKGHDITAALHGLENSLLAIHYITDSITLLGPGQCPFRLQCRTQRRLNNQGEASKQSSGNEAEAEDLAGAEGRASAVGVAAKGTEATGGCRGGGGGGGRGRVDAGRGLGAARVVLRSSTRGNPEWKTGAHWQELAHCRCSVRRLWTHWVTYLPWHSWKGMGIEYW